MNKWLKNNFQRRFRKGFRNIFLRYLYWLCALFVLFGVFEMNKTLKLVLTDHWFEEIKSGRKTHEYRKATPFWTRRILSACGEKMTEDKPHYLLYHPNINNLCVQFQKAYRKNPERMTFEVKALGWSYSGKYSDLRCADPVFDIILGVRIK